MKENRVIPFLAAAIIAGAGASPLRATADGALDPDFGTAGVATINLGANETAQVNAIRSGPLGELAIAGTHLDGTNGNFDFYSCTLTADGSASSCVTPVLALDTFHIDQGNALAYQLDGRRVLAGFASGTAADPEHRAAFIGLDQANGLDVDFSGDGTKTINFASDALDVAINARRNGDLLFAGWYDHEASSPGTGNDCFVGRMHDDGTLDTNFSGNGLVTVGWDLGPDHDDTCTASAIYHDGRMVVAAVVQRADNTESAGIARLATAGTLDTDFSGNGKVLVDFDAVGSASRPSAVAVDHLGRVVVAGRAYKGDGWEAAVFRLRPDGTLDSSFGNGTGKVVFTMSGTAHDVEEVTGLSILPPPSNDIAIAGDFSAAAHEAGFVALLHDDGTFDTSFSGNGRRTVDLDAAHDNGIAGMTVQGGKIVVASGYTARMEQTQAPVLFVDRLYMNRISGDDFESGDRQLWSNFADP